MPKLGKHQIRPAAWATPGLCLLGAAAVGIGVGALSTRGQALITPANAPGYRDIATQCRVVDGDTLHCDGGRIRLLGIDAPELPGHCAEGRDCAPGEPFASARSLGDGMGDGKTLRTETVGVDRYGRTLALVMGARGDLSCWQLAHGQAIYKPRWDNGGRVASRCPNNAR